MRTAILGAFVAAAMLAIPANAAERIVPDEGMGTRSSSTATESELLRWQRRHHYLTLDYQSALVNGGSDALGCAPAKRTNAASKDTRIKPCN